MEKAHKTHTPSRRSFLKKSASLGAGLPLLALNNNELFAESKKKPEQKLNILILGGTSFLGPHQIAYALERGHKISTFTRGKTKPKIFPELFNQVESLIGDREDNLESLKNRKWDVVIDNSGRKTKWTKDTAELLKDQVGLYMYTSSVSVYYPYTGDDFSEERKLVMEIPADATEDEKYLYDYGVMKAQSEQASRDVFGVDRATIIRPSFIVGPGDPTNRFTYWPVRMEEGGVVLLPGKKTDMVQYIDVRDLASFMIHLCENKIAGSFNGAGPGYPMDVQSFVHGVHACFNSSVEYVYIEDHEFLKEREASFVCPWVLPTGKFLGMASASIEKSLANGLKIRPLAETVQATMKWWHSDAVTEEFKNSIKEGERSFFKKEKELIAAWRGPKQ